MIAKTPDPSAIVPTGTNECDLGASGAGPPRGYVVACSARVDGLTVTIDAAHSRLRRAGVDRRFGGSVTLAANPAGQVTGEPRTLAYSPVPAFARAPVDGVLAHANVSRVVVRDAASGAVLAEGSDYRLEPEHGTLALATDGAPVPVLVDYHWSRRRYDLLCLDPQSLALTVLRGTPRARDIAEFLPVRDASHLMPLFHCRVAEGPLELVPVWDIEDGHRRDDAGAVAELRREARRVLEPVRARLRAGLPVTLASYGDSIVALQGGGTPAADTPNGPYRDRHSHFANGARRAIGEDATAALALHDFGDGAGAVHVRCSQAWILVEALQRAFASPVTHLNFGLDGTASGAARLGGLDPLRLRAVMASEADMVLVHFGMNEIGNPATGRHVADIVRMLRQSGKAVIVAGTPRPNAQSGRSHADWLQTNRALAGAAQANGAAFHDTPLLYADGSNGALGLHPKDICAANLHNHPGPYEHRRLGLGLARLLLDD